MEHSNTIQSFVAVIGDMKDSRHLENRKEVQVRLQGILDRLNEKYKDEIVSRFLITLGDEFQGLLSSGKYILDMVNEIRSGWRCTLSVSGSGSDSGRSPRISGQKWRWAQTVRGITAHARRSSC